MPQIRQLTFHNKTGSLVVLSANNSCAERINATREFNNALVCSSQPLQDNELFQVKVEKKVNKIHSGYKPHWNKIIIFEYFHLVIIMEWFFRDRADNV